MSRSGPRTIMGSKDGGGQDDKDDNDDDDDDDDDEDLVILFSRLVSTLPGVCSISTTRACSTGDSGW